MYVKTTDSVHSSRWPWLKTVDLPSSSFSGFQTPNYTNGFVRSTKVSLHHWQDFEGFAFPFVNYQGLYFPVSKLQRASLSRFQVTTRFSLPRFQTELHWFILTTYTVKVTAPMQKSCKGNIVDAIACYIHDILYHISHLLLLNNASSIAYFTWGRVIIHMII